MVFAELEVLYNAHEHYAECEKSGVLYNRVPVAAAVTYLTAGRTEDLYPRYCADDKEDGPYNLVSFE